MSAALISVRDIACAPGGERVIEGVSCELHRGEITVVLGPSGAGKSTLLRAIAGFEPVVEGCIRRGDDVLSEPGRTLPPERRDFGIVVQNFALFPHLTALGNIAFGLAGAKRKTRAHRWLERIGLAGRAAAYPHELSGGEQQRVALARALAREPSVILLDEAFSSLDQQLRQSLRRETEQLLREAGVATLVVSHDPDEAMELADRIVVMDSGRVVQAGSPHAVYWQPASAAAARLLGEVNELAGTVSGSACTTPFGAFPAPGLAEGQRACALVRPGAVDVQRSSVGALQVASARFLGSQTRLLIKRADGGEERLVALVPDGAGFERGDRVTVRFLPDRVQVLPSGG